MTGMPEWNYPAFNALAAELRAEGFDVFNPAEAFEADTSLAFEQYMRADIAALLECAAVVVLDGWRQSVGAVLEVAVATAMNLPVWTQDRQPIGSHDRRSDLKQLLGIEAPKSDESILQEAQRLVHGDRGEAYGHPFSDFSKTAKIWEGVLGCEVSPEQVALCMIGVKMSRQVNKPKRDNVVDMAGYAETLQMVVERRQELGL